MNSFKSIVLAGLVSTSLAHSFECSQIAKQGSDYFGIMGSTIIKLTPLSATYELSGDATIAIPTVEFQGVKTTFRDATVQVPVQERVVWSPIDAELRSQKTVQKYVQNTIGGSGEINVGEKTQTTEFSAYTLLSTS